MAGLQEFHSFMAKFVNLWKHGFKAHLRIQTKDRKATISMEVEPGQAFPPRKPGPSRLRRSERRAETRRLAEEAKAQENTAQEAKAQEATAGQAKAKQAAEALNENAEAEDAKADVEKAVEEPKTKDAGKAPAPG